MKKDLSTEQKILQAARKIFIKQGYDGGKMQDIADEAGINKALLHYYFQSKEKLFEVIFLEAFSQFSPRMLSVMNSEKTFFEKLEEFINTYIDMLAQNPSIPIFILTEINKDAQALFNKMFGAKTPPPIQQFLILVEEESAKGNIKKISPQHLLLSMIGLCVFPFAARPMFQRAMKMTDAQYNKFLSERKTEVFQLLKDSLQNNKLSKANFRK